jgi:hypothetical protein
LPLVVTGAIAAAWLAAIVTLAVTTANPITLNRVQIEDSDLVVTARILPGKPTTAQVEREWKIGAKLETITVENIGKTPARPGKLYLIPLSRRMGDVYIVTPTRLPGKSPLVYPAVPDATRQLEAILNRSSS